MELCLSTGIIAEIREVLARPRVRQKFPALTDELTARLLAAIEQQAVLIPEVPQVFAYDRDRKDEPYINLSIAAEARYLVSRDRDILDLAKPTHPDGVRLRSLAPQLLILDPVSFLLETRK